MTIPASGVFSIYSGPLPIAFGGGTWFEPPDDCATQVANSKTLSSALACSMAGASGTAGGQFSRGRLRIDGTDYAIDALPRGFTILTAQYYPQFTRYGSTGNASGTVECTVGIGGVRNINDSPFDISDLSASNLLGAHTFSHSGSVSPTGGIITQFGANSAITVDPGVGPPFITGTYAVKSVVLRVSFDEGHILTRDADAVGYVAPQWINPQGG